MHSLVVNGAFVVPPWVGDIAKSEDFGIVIEILKLNIINYRSLLVTNT